MGRRGTLLMIIFLLLGCACAEKTVDITYRFGSREEQKIAVTIDDCYHAEDVRAVLDILQANDVRATFFPIGKALKYEDAALWQEVVASGCEIGNHSWGHTYLTKLSRQKIKFQMLRTQEKVDALLDCHYPMQVMRPPMGKTNPKVEESVAEVGYLAVVKWDVSETDPEKALADVQNGSILLFHARKKDAECLSVLIPQLVAEGYELVTVSELLGLPEIECSAEKYVYHRRDTEENIRPDAVPQN